MTHQEIEHQDIIERYVRNDLSATDRGAFQEHFFACDECFEQVQTTERFIAGVNHAAATGVLQNAPAAAPLPFLRRARSLFTGTTGPVDWSGISILKPAVVLILMVVLIAGAIFYFRSRDKTSERELAKDGAPSVQPGNNASGRKDDARALQVGTNQNKEPANSQQTGTPKPLLVEGPGKGTKERRVVASTGRKPRVNESNQSQPGISESEATRSVNSGAAGAKLSEVKRVFVEALGDQPANREVRRLLVKQLRSSNRFTVAQSKDDADAVLKFSALPGRETRVIVRLVNANGFVIWPVDTTGSGREYTGRADESASKIVADVLLEIRKTKQEE